MFVISKIVWFLAAPSNALILLTVLGVALTATHYARTGRWLAYASLAMLALAGLSPLPNALLLPLENRFPVYQADRKSAPAGIIVLGGGTDARVSFTRKAGLELNEAGDRILAMLELALKYPEAKIIFTGGAGALLGDLSPEADEVRKNIARYGVPPERIIFENRSRTTYENATETYKLAAPKLEQRWLLVTSAWHMPRSIASFRAAGFNVEAYPVDFRTAGFEALHDPFAEVSRGLRRFDMAVREWLGLVGYRVTGATRELLPSP